MSWQQTYSFQSLFALYRKITGLKLKDYEILNNALREQLNFHNEQGDLVDPINKIEKIVVENSTYVGKVYGTRITLADGRIFETVINDKKSFTQNGNYGCDIYEWKEIKKEK